MKRYLLFALVAAALSVSFQGNAAQNLEAELMKMFRLGDGEKTPFDNVDRMTETLLATYAQPDQAAKIVFTKARVYAGSGQVQPKKTIEAATTALGYKELDPPSRLLCYVYWGDAIQVSHAGVTGDKLAKARGEAVMPYLRGLKEALKHGLPDAKPDLPRVNRIGRFRDADPEKQREVVRKHEEQLKARERGKFERKMVRYRYMLTSQIAFLYSRFPFASEEIRALAEKALNDKAAVERLMSSVDAAVKKRMEKGGRLEANFDPGPVEESIFELEFPPGAKVSDMRKSSGTSARDVQERSGRKSSAVQVSGAAKPTQRESMNAEERETAIYTGTVKNLSGEPIAGVDVRCDLITIKPTRQRRVGEFHTQTDSEGRFEVGPLARFDKKTAVRSLIFRHPDYAVGTFSESRPDRKVAKGGEIEMVLRSPASLTGTVRDEAGSVVEGASVSASMRASSSRGENYFSFRMWEENEMAVRTDLQGRFTISHIPKECRLEIDVLKKGYVRYSTVRQHGGRYPVRTGEDLQIVLQKGGVIEGQLTRDGKRAEGLQVPLRAWGEKGWTRATTELDGSFEIIGLPDGHYMIYTEAGGMPEYNAVLYGARHAVEVTASNTPIKVSLLLRKTVPVLIQISDGSSKEKLEGIDCRIASWGYEFAVIAVGRSDENGECKLQVPSGHYVVSASGWRNGRHSRFEKKIEIVDGHSESKVELAITPRPSLRGQLVKTDGSPVAGTVRIGRDSAIADHTGRFKIAMLSFHDLEEIGFAFDSEKTLGTGFLLAEEEKNKPLNLVLKPLSRVTGRILNSEGMNEGAASLRVGVRTHPGGSQWSSVWESLWNAQVDTEGNFAVQGLPYGLTYVLSAEKPGYVGYTNVNVFSGETGEIVTDVRMQSRARNGDESVKWTRTVSGQVLNEKNEAMAGVRVWSLSDASGWTEDVTDTRGQFTLSSLPEGKSIGVTAKTAGYGSSSTNVPGDVDTVVIRMSPQGAELIGKPAPDLHVEKWLNTEPVALKDLRGKVVWLIIDTYFPYLRTRLNEIDDTMSKFEEKGLKVIVVHDRVVEGQDIRNKLLRFVEEGGTTIPIGIDGEKSAVLGMVPANRHYSYRGATSTLYAPKGGHASYLIDKQGKVRVSPTHSNRDEWIKKLLAEEYPPRRITYGERLKQRGVVLPVPAGSDGTVETVSDKPSDSGKHTTPSDKVRDETVQPPASDLEPRIQTDERSGKSREAPGRSHGEWSGWSLSDEQLAEIEERLRTFKASGKSMWGSETWMKDAAYCESLTTTELAEECFERPIFWSESGVHNDVSVAYMRLRILHNGFAELFQRDDMWKGIGHVLKLVERKIDLRSDRETLLNDTLLLQQHEALMGIPELQEQLEGREEFFIGIHLGILEKMRSFMRAYHSESDNWTTVPFVMESSNVYASALELAKRVAPAVCEKLPQPSRPKGHHDRDGLLRHLDSTIANLHQIVGATEVLSQGVPNASVIDMSKAALVKGPQDELSESESTKLGSNVPSNRVVRVLVLDSETKGPLPEASMELIYGSTSLPLQTDAQGQCPVELPAEEKLGLIQAKAAASKGE